MEKSSTATLECEDIKTRLQNDDEDSIPLADDDVSASVLGMIFLLKYIFKKKRLGFEGTFICIGHKICYIGRTKLPGGTTVSRV